MRARWALLALALTGAAQAPSREGETTLTRAQVREMAPEALTRRLFGDMAQIMYPLRYSDRYARSWMHLQWLRFLTRPRDTYRAGVCETDLVTVEFERAGFALGDDPPVRPLRFHIATVYFIQDLAKAREGGPSVDEQWELRWACQAFDPRQAPLISAESPFEVVGAIQPLADLIDAARAGRTTAPIECTGPAGAAIAQDECLRGLARLRPERLSIAQLIGGCGRGETRIHCRRIEIAEEGREAVQITFELLPETEPHPPARIIVGPAPREPDH